MPEAAETATGALQPLAEPALTPIQARRAAWIRRRGLHAAAVRFWRLALPAAMAALVAVVGGQAVYGAFFAGPRGLLENREVRMVNPRFFGRNARGEPYVLTADSATRDGRAPDLVHLVRPRLTLQGGGSEAQRAGRPAPPPHRSGGDRGLYDETTRVLVMDGHAWVDDGQGSVFRSEHAVMDTDSGEVAGRVPVAGDGPLGHIDAQAYAVYDRGARVVFTGRVHTHVKNGAPAGEGPSR